MWKWIVLLVVILALAGGGLGYLITQGGEMEGMSFSFGSGNSEPEATPVRIETAQTGDLVRTVSAPGSIEPRTLVQISSQVSAKVLAVPFREGDAVQAGDVILRLDPQNLVAQLESAKAGVRSEEARLDGSKADLINARLEYERFQQLVETGDAPQADLDAAEARYLRARSNLRVIEASIEIAEANIDRVNKDLENTVISSPIDGTVIALNTEVGETVIVGTTNNPGSIVMEIADLSSMLVKAQVDETNIAPVAVGQPATVYINAYDGEEFRGKVEKIGRKRRVSASGTGYFIIEIALELEEGRSLLSGLTASVDIEVEPFFDVVKVPSQAVIDVRVEELPDEIREMDLVESEKTYTDIVYRLVDGKAIATPVRKGPSDLTHTVVIEGLGPDDVIVVGPYRVLDPGRGDFLKHEQDIRDEDAPEEDEDAEAGDSEAGDEAGELDESGDDSEGDSGAESDREGEQVAEADDETATAEVTEEQGG